jgi:serine phosphatase RsbU (regulator of sigma subunit)
MVDGRAITLATTVERLRLELEDVRKQVVVEQAKGLLAERLGCPLEEAHGHLISVAAANTLDQSAVAALLLGVEPPPEKKTRPTTAVFDHVCCPADITQPRPGEEPHWIGPVLDAVQGPASLMSPVRDLAGKVVDFHVVAVNADATDRPGTSSAELLGRDLLRSYPGLALSDLFDAYVQVLETGLPLRRTPREYSSVARGRVVPTTMSVRACRVGGCILASWRFHDDRGDLSAQLDQAQRIGNLGWGEWDLTTGGIHWSDQLYGIFGRSPVKGPLDLDELGAVIVPDDLPVAEELMQTLLGRREQADVEFRIDRGQSIRHLRVMAEPVLDGSGAPAVLRCLFQDVTQRRLDEQRLQASRRQVEQQRQKLAEERHLVVQLQRAVMPHPERPVRLPGLEAAFRYLPAECETRVGGDWYEATELPSGQVFLAIGDVSGHGLPAATAMAKLRNALSGLAFTGACPDLLLGWLNQLMLHRQAALTASGIAGLFDPVARTLTWAQAGHPPPILVRAGEARMLEQPEGILLGACDDAEFALAVTELQTGDLLLFYTDGLVERRDRDLFDGFDLLVATASGCAGSDLELDTAIGRILEGVGGANPDDDTCLVAVRIR